MKEKKSKSAKSAGEKMTMVNLKVSVRDQAKIAAAIQKVKLNEFVESSIIRSVKKVMGVK